jgi:hypothetical protein
VSVYVYMYIHNMFFDPFAFYGDVGVILAVTVSANGRTCAILGGLELGCLEFFIL